MSGISLENLRNAMSRCADCKFDRRGCARNEAHASGRGCKGFVDSAGIEVEELKREPAELKYRLAVESGRYRMEVLIRKDRPAGSAVWEAALVGMGPHNTVPPDHARLYGRMLAKASRVAEYLDGELD